jgi:hypothetical protein
MPLEMIVGISVYQQPALHDLITEINPTPQFGSAINRSLIQGHGLCFDLLPVAKPADVRPVCRNRIELKF